jgi:iron complex transport system substrate-binding protein
MPKLKKLLALLLFSIFILSLSACSNNNSIDKNNTSETSQGTSYPLNFKDSYNRAIKIDKEPQRIISAAPNITEIVYALGKGDKLIGRTDFCNFPEEAKKVQSIGGIQDASIEKIVELKPDIVIASSIITKDIVQKLEALNIKVVVISKDDSLEGTYDVINQVGMVLNANAKATEVVSNMKKRIDTITQKVKGKNTPSVYYALSYGKEGDFTAGRNTFIGKLIVMAGGRNAADDADGWAYSLERLIEKNPDILICSNTNNTKSGIKNASGYKDLTAAKNDKIYEINMDILNRQGPRLADGLESLAKIIHPEAFK